MPRLTPTPPSRALETRPPSRILRRWLAGLLGLSLVCLASCASKSAKPEIVEGSEESEEGPTYLVGLIQLVNPEQQFVLIKTQGSMVLPPGHSLSALDATGTWSQLEITPEKKDDFITADITSGSPRIGNLVIYRPKQQFNETPGEPSPPTLPPGVPSGQPPPIAPLQPTQPPPIAPLQPTQPPPIAPLEPTQPPPIAPLQPTQPPPIAPLQPTQPPPIEPLVPLPPSAEGVAN